MVRIFKEEKVHIHVCHMSAVCLVCSAHTFFHVHMLIGQLTQTSVFISRQVVFSTIDFVSSNLGPQFVESPPVILATLYEDMANTIPLVFVLSPGSDPMSSFLRFAKEMSYAERCGVCGQVNYPMHH